VAGLPVVAAVERATGRVRTRVVANVTAENLERVLKDTTSRTATIHTDEFVSYKRATRDFADHRTVNHRSGEYASPDGVHCNTAESFFSRLKRSIFGVHHRVSREHLHRYVSHMQFLHNNRLLTDGERLVAAIRSADGKRLTYRACTI
jgi:transposase-like protein